MSIEKARPILSNGATLSLGELSPGYEMIPSHYHKTFPIVGVYHEMRTFESVFRWGENRTNVPLTTKHIV